MRDQAVPFVFPFDTTPLQVHIVRYRAIVR
jgi:hypothetical protein